jgi:pimeloyl-ACP methyl ester carboxylesterase
MTDFSSTMSLHVPLSTMAGFMVALEAYDERAGLPTLAAVDTAVVCGDHDWMTPLRMSKRMAHVLQGDFIVIENAGHMLIMEAADKIAPLIVAQVRRHTPAADRPAAGETP